MTEKERAAAVTGALKAEYPNASCTLDYDDAWKLLVSVRLAAQCTDERVNIITQRLYAIYPTPEALAEAGEEAICEIVKPCGLGRSKSRDIAACMKILVEKYGGKVPDSMESLLSLPGVGRKSANLILGDVFKKPAMVCDTHCIRIMNRLRFCDTKDPKKVEDIMWKLFPEKEGSDLCHRLVIHGRAVCSARKKPECEKCVLEHLCPSAKVYES